MALTAVFGVSLLIAVLLSGLAARTVLSTELIFLAAGALTGAGGLALLHLAPGTALVTQLADLALFTILLTDGQRAGRSELKEAWRLSGRALGLGMPLAFVLAALLTRALTGLSWVDSLLVGAVLSPTDPVFASALITRRDVPLRLRRLLNVESGLNDGLALPAVVILIAVAAGTGAPVATTLLELVGGLALGVALPVAVFALSRLPLLGSSPRYQPFGPLAVGVLIYAICHLTGANAYLAAFAAGSTTATVAPRAAEAFAGVGEAAAEIVKFLALLVFGALLTPTLLGRVSIGGYVLGLLSLALVRPLSLLVSLLGTKLPRRELLAAAWFGPKGFASVVYGLLVLASTVTARQRIFGVVAVAIVLSIVAHSSTDVPVAGLFREHPAPESEDAPP